MARTERVIAAPPSAVFGVLADPRSYVYWVIGSREIRAADEAWPEPGSRFDHTVNIGPLRIRDHTTVERVERDRFLQLNAKARPFGTARIKIDLREQAAGTRVTMVEDAADGLTAFLFQPLMHLAMRRRNAHSLERLAELAEGRAPMPGEEGEAPSLRPGEPGPVVNPTLHDRDAARGPAAAAVGRGGLAGVAGAVAMSVSTNVEMRLRGRPPSDAPARAIERVLGTRIEGRKRRVRAAAAGHLATSLGLGSARGAMDAAGVPGAAAGAATFALALAPEVVVVPALGAGPPPWRWGVAETAISVLHHAVYAGTVLAVYGALRRR
jgi:uncharacterized protein YndB with AHSA1/START domain